MNVPTVTASQIRCALLLREEIALLDLRHEAAYATGHPLFAANMAADRIGLEAEMRLPRSRPGSWRVTNFSGMSIPMQKPLANWSSPEGTRPRCPRTKSPG